MCWGYTLINKIATKIKVTRPVTWNKSGGYPNCHRLIIKMIATGTEFLQNDFTS